MSGNRDCENDNVKTNSVFAINSSYFRDGRQYHPRKKQKRTKIYKKNKEKRQKKKEKDNKKEKKEKKIKIHTQRKDVAIPQSLDVKKKTHRERDSGTGDRPPRYAGEKMCVGPGGSTIMENTARLPDNAVMGVAG